MTNTPVTVRDLIQWLQTQEQDAIISVNSRDYSGDSYRSIDLQESDLGPTGGKNLEIIDFRGNQFVKPDAPYYGKVYIQFGEN